jgi:hypothetical protein
MRKMVKVALVVLTALLVVSLVPYTARAQDGVVNDPALVWSSGLLDADNTVLYSITMVAGEKALKDVVINAVVPKDATFVESFWTPKAATFGGEKSGTVTWKLPELASQTFVGPFTFRVKFTGSNAKDFEAPGGAKATATFTGGSAEAIVSKTNVFHLEETGKIEITPKGTSDLVPVGETGIFISVPANAVTKNVTLNFTRVAITDKTPLPKVAEETWWCALVSITADADVKFAQPILVILPTRRALLPNAVIPVFTQEAGKDFVLAGDGTKKDAAAEAIINAYGSSAWIMLNAATFGTTARQIAVGINQQIRVNSVSPVVNTSNIRPPVHRVMILPLGSNLNALAT